MSLQNFRTAPAEQERTPLDQTAQLWTLLYGTWGSPRRASRMTSRRDHDRKYSDIESYSFNASHLAAHLAGTATYAATLGAAGTARAGCKDYDSADEAEILAALDQAQQKGITAAAIVMPGSAGEHTGGHLWVFYDRPYAESDIRAQLRTIRRSGKGEDYPSGNPIRLPLGYHQIKKTRGILILQDRRRFNLDTQLAAGIEALLSLPRNGKPQAAPLMRASPAGAAWGEAYKPDEWENLPDGGPLWHSAYVAAVASRPGREPLAALQRGERAVITKKDDTIDDSDSVQIAALCYNLMSGNVCESHIRAIALYLKDTIRPGRVLEHFKAHVDAELVRYRPTHYKPQPIRYIGVVQQPEPLPPAEYKPVPKSRARHDRPQRVAGPAGYLSWLHTQVDPQSGSVMLSQSQCAERLGCCVRTIKRYEKALGTQIERRVFARRQAGCLFILAPDVVTTLPADVVIADAPIAQQSAENAQPATTQVEHTAPPVPEPPAPPALVDAIRWAIVAMEKQAVNPETGETWRGRANPDRVRGWIAEHYPTLDTVELETLYPQVRKQMQAQRAARKKRDFWNGERRRIGALEDGPLIAALWGAASRMQAAQRKNPQSPWAKRCAALFAIHDDERRRRGLAAGDSPPPAQDRPSRKAAKARMQALASVVNAEPKISTEDSAPAQIGFASLSDQASEEDLIWMRERAPAKPKRRRPAAAQQGVLPRECSPQSPAPAGADDPTVPNVARLIAYAYTLREQRQAVTQQQGKT